MTDEQIAINGDIQAIRCALDGLVGYSGLLTPEDIMELCRVSNRLDTFLIKITERKDEGTL